jgi:hypothetical protein
MLGEAPITEIKHGHVYDAPCGTRVPPVTLRAVVTAITVALFLATR